jgi:1-acyl-sn-glycerol-3-phosphate acyltransferase
MAATDTRTSPAWLRLAPEHCEPVTSAYLAAMTVGTPIVRHWGRLEVVGLEHLPTSGPTLCVGNHDSYWDPVVVGVAGLPRRQIRALAKSTLWKTKPLARILDGMGQIPIERGKGDTRALDTAIEELRGGACIGVFPEGTISRGTRLRARSGAGRLAVAVPEATIVCVTIRGSVDIVRVPKRPRIEVAFFPPASGGVREGESAAELTVRLMDEVRERAPIAIPGRRRTAAKYRRRAAEAAEAGSGGTESGETEPGGTEPGETEPGGTEPGGTEPGETPTPAADSA